MIQARTGRACSTCAMSAARAVHSAVRGLRQGAGAPLLSRASRAGDGRPSDREAEREGGASAVPTCFGETGHGARQFVLTSRACVAASKPSAVSLSCSGTDTRKLGHVRAASLGQSLAERLL